ncbi:hypothetical protein L227DRAFT_113082 [Lentinus tigrinus ALCF2SS1-6]|uniref:Uncharacterized protein n=1 Tax=Lentinus tigrinus ALCF2SS1-6 TaxID=1328759 RepID=A0A5C2S7F6_9APHY|nr:hypothetical protein L227DRAFT_113082 [Lentinus tigrinus ALCF2SS1-6]
MRLLTCIHARQSNSCETQVLCPSSLTRECLDSSYNIRLTGSHYAVQHSVTSVLACRFLLNLRRVEVGRYTTQSVFTATTVRFTPDPSNPTESTASGPGSQRTNTLPPFISCMSELVDMGFSTSTSHQTGQGDSEYEDGTELASVVDHRMPAP